MTRDKSLIDLIVPVLNESEHIIKNTEAMLAAIRAIGYIPHIIIVDDGSTDDTWDKIASLCSLHPEIEGVRLSRNFGKDCALFVGISHSKGDAAITIDSDGQHPISLLSKLVEKWELGFLIVNAVKIERHGETFLTKMRATIFNGFMSKLMGENIQGASDYKLLDKKIIKIVQSNITSNAIYRFLVAGLGFPSINLPMNTLESPRKTRWRLSSLFELAIRAIIFHTDVPIKAFFAVLMLTLLLICSLFFILLIALIAGNVPTGYSTILALILINLCITVIGLTGLSVYLKGTLDIVAKRSGPIIWERLSEKVLLDE